MPYHHYYHHPYSTRNPVKPAKYKDTMAVTKAVKPAKLQGRGGRGQFREAGHVLGRGAHGQPREAGSRQSGLFGADRGGRDGRRAASSSRPRRIIRKTGLARPFRRALD